MSVYLSYNKYYIFYQYIYANDLYIDKKIYKNKTLIIIVYIL
jgi:hypothetical protein